MLLNKIILLVFLLFPGFTLVGGSQGSYNKNLNIEALNSLRVNSLNVSIIQLIANPEKYNGKAIQVEGFINIEFEGTAIYFHQEDLDYSLSKNGIWVSFKSREEAFEKKKKFGRKYVLLAGTFSSESQGHFNLFSGSISDITRLEVLEKRKN